MHPLKRHFHTTNPEFEMQRAYPNPFLSIAEMLAGKKPVVGQWVEQIDGCWMHWSSETDRAYKEREQRAMQPRRRRSAKAA